MTYNVLASALIKPQSYPRSSEESLDPQLRVPALVQRIQELEADVLCLQEVDAEILAALRETLEPLGYEHRYLARAATQPDGCATFARGLTGHTWHELRYSDADRGQSDSGHVALTLDCSLAGRRVVIANTHLKWDPPGVPAAAQWGARQMSELLKSLEALQAEGTVVCGDFNSVARDEVVRLLRIARFKEAFDGERDTTFTVVTNQKPRKIDYIFHSMRLRSRPHALTQLTDRSTLPSADEPSDHLPVVVDLDWAVGGRKS